MAPDSPAKLFELLDEFELFEEFDEFDEFDEFEPFSRPRKESIVVPQVIQVNGTPALAKAC